MQNRKICYWRVTGALFWVKNIKSAIWDRTPPHLHIKSSLYVCRRVQGSQIFKQNRIILFHSRVIVILLIWVSLAWGGCCRWVGDILSEQLLSQLVQDLLNFSVFSSLWLWGGAGGWGCLGASGDMGVSPHARTCTHMHAHACTHMYTCIEIANGCQHGGIHVYHVYHV